MLNGGKAVRDRDGKVIQAAAFQKGEQEAEPGRIKADRRWFGKLGNSLEIPPADSAQVILGSSLRLHWIISGRHLLLKSGTLTRSS
jgi:hypothetical protein